MRSPRSRTYVRYIYENANIDTQRDIRCAKITLYYCTLEVVATVRRTNRARARARTGGKKVNGRADIPTTLLALIRPPAIGSLLKRFPEISRQVVTNYPGNTLMPGARQTWCERSCAEFPRGTRPAKPAASALCPAVLVLNYRNIDGHVARVTYGYSCHLSAAAAAAAAANFVHTLEKAILIPDVISGSVCIRRTSSVPRSLLGLPRPYRIVLYRGKECRARKKISIPNTNRY